MEIYSQGGQMTNLIISLVPLFLIVAIGFYSVYWSNKRQKKKEQDKEPQPARIKVVPKDTFIRPLEDLKKIRRFLISNREWIVSKTKNIRFASTWTPYITTYASAIEQILTQEFEI